MRRCHVDRGSGIPSEPDPSSRVGWWYGVVQVVYMALPEPADLGRDTAGVVSEQVIVVIRWLEADIPPYGPGIPLRSVAVRQIGQPQVASGIRCKRDGRGSGSW